MKKQYLVLSILFAFLLSQSACISGKDNIKGSNKIVQKEFPISDYSDVLLKSFNNIVYEQKESESPHLIVEIDDNLMEYINVSVTDGVLSVDIDKKHSIKPNKFVVYTNSKSLNSVQLSGAGSFSANNKVKTDDLFLTTSGAGNISFEALEANTTKCNVSGVGNIKLIGIANSSEFDVSGVGNINAKELVQNDATCDVSGVGSVEVQATNKLEAHVSGVGSIKYKGTPDQFTQSKSGIGSISKIN